MATVSTNPKSVKVAKRQLVRDGNLLIHLEEDQRRLILTREDVQMLKEIGVSVPNVGASVNIEDSINPVTSEPSKTWAKLVI